MIEVELNFDRDFPFIKQPELADIQNAIAKDLNFKWRIHIDEVFDRWNETYNMDKAAWKRFNKEIHSFKVKEFVTNK